MDWINLLTVSNWIAIIAVIIAAFSASITAANYFAGRRERPEKPTVFRRLTCGPWKQSPLMPPSQPAGKTKAP